MSYNKSHCILLSGDVVYQYMVVEQERYSYIVIPVERDKYPRKLQVPAHYLYGKNAFTYMHSILYFLNFTFPGVSY